MFQVQDVYDDAKKIVGICDDNKLFRLMTEAVTLVANKADLEGWKGFLDICTAGCHCRDTTTCNNPAGCGRRLISLPREVETIIGVNIGGQPVLGYNQLFEFHLNGPGSCRTVCEWKWQDQGDYHFTYKDIHRPSKLVAYTQLPDDNGAQLIVYGYDDQGNVLQRLVNGIWVSGYQVPTIYGVALPDVGAPKIARITGVTKAKTAGSIRLSTIDDTGATGTLLAVYEPDETTPQFRRILLNRSCNWVRIAYLKTNPLLSSQTDRIPLNSRIGFLLALKAVKSYLEIQIENAHMFEADATRIEIEAQQKKEAGTYMPPQIIDMSNPRDKYDYDIR